MQKFLTGAALAALLSSNVNAAEWEVRISGYYDAFVTYAGHSSANSNVDADGLDVSSDAEIHFRPSIVLDNGIKIGAIIELEGENAGDQIDESFVFVEGSFGKVLIGSENSAGFLLHMRAPNTLRRALHEIPDFLPIDGTFGGINVGDDFARGTLGETRLENDRNNDAKRITYLTPDISGLTVGVSYARDGNQDNFGPTDCNAASICNIFDVGAKYKVKIGDVKLAMSGRWGIAENDGAGLRPQVWGAALQVGYGGFTVGGSFAEQNDSGTEDGTGYDLGAVYKTGPWAFSATWFHGENVDDERPVLGADEEIDIFLAGVQYSLAKGVKLDFFGGYVDFREDVGDAGGAGDDVTGFVIGTAIGLKF